MRHTIFLFGEAEKGELCTPMLCKSLGQLAQIFGNPPEESQGLFYAVQSLLYQRELIYFRISEEGFSYEEYMRGLKLLRNANLKIPTLTAICMPGVGDPNIVDATIPVCETHRSLLIINEKDLYDFLTSTRNQ